MCAGNYLEGVAHASARASTSDPWWWWSILIVYVARLEKEWENLSTAEFPASHTYQKTDSPVVQQQRQNLKLQGQLRPLTTDTETQTSILSVFDSLLLFSWGNVPLCGLEVQLESRPFLIPFVTLVPEERCQLIGTFPIIECLNIRQLIINVTDSDSNKIFFILLILVK